MRVVVIGAGMAGLTAAHFLRAEGSEVVLLERRKGAGLETSYANGSVLHPGLADPWNSPGLFGELLRNLGREDSAILLRLAQLPRLFAWGIGFLRQSRPVNFRRNALHAMRLSMYSLRVLRQLRTDLALQYQARQDGVLVLFRTERKLDEAWSWARSFQPEGKRCRVLTAPELLALEPALAPIGSQLFGALHFPDEESGDPYAYCLGLESALRQAGVEILYDREAVAWQIDGNHVVGMRDSQGILHRGDRFLIAAASYSTPLAAAAGLSIPVRPAKGYSITVPRGTSGTAPNVPVVDNDLHVAVVPVGGDRVRVAGTAEFTGYDTSVNEARVRNLRDLLQRLYPDYVAQLRPQDIVPWAGLRPLCQDGVPLVGGSRLENLYFNTGHGQLGWTMAAGSGRLAADLLLGKAPGIDPVPYDPRRFNGRVI